MKINITKHCVTILTAGTLISGTRYVKPKITELEFPIRGHEVSEKVDVNWDNYGKDYKYVVIRAGDGLHYDEKFEENYKIARKKKIPVGVFIDNYLAKEIHCDENRIVINAERRYSTTKIEQLIGKKIDYPVYLRLDYGDRPIEDALPKAYANALLDRYELIMTHNDFIPGVYSNEHNIEYLREVVEDFDSRFAFLLENEKKEELPLLKEYREKNNVLIVNNPQEIAASFENVPQEEKLEEYVYSKTNYRDRNSSVSLIIFGLFDVMLLSKMGYDKYNENKKESEEQVESFVVKL